jgi:hypothetical protein
MTAVTEHGMSEEIRKGLVSYVWWNGTLVVYCQKLDK